MAYFHKIFLTIIFGIVVAFSTNTVLSQEKVTLDTPGIYATIAKRFLSIIEDCESLKTQQEDLECSIRALWKFADISADDHLSAAEINRFFRILSANFAYEKYVDDFDEYNAALRKGEFAKQPENHEILVAIASGAFGAVLTPMLIANLDYNNDGLLSRSEIFQDTEWEALIVSMRLEDGKLPKNLEHSLNKLRMMLLPLLLGR